MTCDNFSAIMKLFFVLLLLIDTDINFRLKVELINTQNKHFLSGLAKIKSVSKMSQG